jgi:hypothetical protein
MRCTLLIGWLLALGCAPRGPGPNVWAHEGAVLTPQGPVEIAVVGGSGSVEGLAVVADIVRRGAPDAVFLTGDQLPRGTWVRHNEVATAWGDTPVVWVPGRAERRGDRGLRRMSQAVGDLGVPDLGGNVLWHHFDVHLGEARWRVVALDAGKRKMGSMRWTDQLFWLPRVVAGDDFDHLILLIGAPSDSLAARRLRADPTATRELLDVVDHHADPTRLMLVLQGGTPTNELLLPAGPWGAAHVVAGRSSGPTASLRAEGTSAVGSIRHNVSLAPAFATAMIEFQARQLTAGLATTAVPSSHTLEQRPGTAGFWHITLDGSGITLAFHPIVEGEARTMLALAFHASRGWAAVPP